MPRAASASSSSSVPLHYVSLPATINLTDTAALDYAKCVLGTVSCRWKNCGVSVNSLSALQQHYYRHVARDHRRAPQHGKKSCKCQVANCTKSAYPSTSALRHHIDETHIGHARLVCPLKECNETFLAGKPALFSHHLAHSHPDNYNQNILPNKVLKPSANLQPAELRPLFPLPGSSISASTSYLHRVAPAKRRAPTQLQREATQLLDAASVNGANLQSPRKTARLRRTTTSARSLASVPGGSTQASQSNSESDSETEDGVSKKKDFPDVLLYGSAWRTSTLVFAKSSGVRARDSGRGLDDRVSTRAARGLPPKRRAQLSRPPTYKGDAQAAYQERAEPAVLFNAFRKKELFVNGGAGALLVADAWVDREGRDV